MNSTINLQATQGLETILDTLELFEIVLEHLPMKDLLFAQLVCRKWQTTIQSSPRLQEALFFKPCSADHASLSSLGAENSSTEASSLPSSPSFPTASTNITLAGNDFQPNPLLQSKFPLFFTRRTAVYQASGFNAMLTLPWSKDDRARAAFARADASWRKMLVVQPAAAISRVEILYVVGGWDGDEATAADDFNEPLIDRLRMGWVYDRCCEVALEPLGSFILRWHMLKSARLWKPKLTLYLHRSEGSVPRETGWAWQAMWSRGYSQVKIVRRPRKFPIEEVEVDPHFIRPYRIPAHFLLDEEDVLAA